MRAASAQGDLPAACLFLTQRCKESASHAKGLRGDLKRAFGLEVPEMGTKVRPDGTSYEYVQRWVEPKGRVMTQRERELFEETEFTRPVDFHSWRRAYNQALADAGVNAQQAAALAGHASLDAHSRYLHNTSKARESPVAALPAISIRRVPANDAEGFASGSAETPRLAAGAERQLTLFSAVRVVGHEGLAVTETVRGVVPSRPNNCPRRTP